MPELPKIYVKEFLLSIVLILIADISTFSQIIRAPEFNVEAGSTLSTGKQPPFWILSNQYGLINAEKYNGYFRIGLKSSFIKEKKLDYAYGFDLVGRSGNSNFYLHQAYVKLKYRFLVLQGGNIEEKFGNQDSSLSTGGLLWSGNSRPMPKVTILVPDYTSVPFTNNLLEFKGGISHGWFGNDPYVKNSWLHHKYFYLQLGGKLPFHVHFGFHHFAQWAGVSADPKFGQLPRSFNDFVKVLLAKKGSEGSPPDEKRFALGNHIGSRNFGIDAEFSKTKISLYWQTIFEDSSGRAFRNIKDGLWGVALKIKDNNSLINKIVYEFVNTTNQSGRYVEYWSLNGEKYFYPVQGGVYHYVEGDDNYFNSDIYFGGWTYKNMVIGTPLISSPAMKSDVKSNLETIWNNKITCHHIGLEGRYNRILYTFLATYYLNYGINSAPIEPGIPQVSFLVKARIINWLPWGITSDLCLGVDHGRLYGNNVGLRISLLKAGKL